VVIEEEDALQGVSERVEERRARDMSRSRGVVVAVLRRKGLSDIDVGASVRIRPEKSEGDGDVGGGVEVDLVDGDVGPEKGLGAVGVEAVAGVVDGPVEAVG